MKKNPIRISIVEDTEHIMNALKSEILEIEDILLVSTYTNAEDALKKLVREKPNVVIMDIGLPQMQGTECMMRILKKVPEMSFLMFTVYESSEHVFDSLKAGASGYILKREGAEGVIEGVREVIAGGAPMSRTIAKRVLKSFQPEKRLIENISQREREILNLLSKGFLYKEIADKLTPPIKIGTVKQHIHRIYQKLQVNNRTEAIKKYLGYE